MPTLGDRIRHYRRQRRLTLQEVADKLDVTPAAVSHWEAGRTEPNPDRMHSLAKALGVRVDQLSSSVAKETAPRDQARVKAEINEILAEARRRIADLEGRPVAEVRLSYTITPSD